MNLLTDTLPETIKVGDIDYPIETDYRAALRIMLAFEDNELADQEKQIIVLANLFTEHVPDDLDAALTAATWYLNCGETPKQADDSQRLVSFSKDARFPPMPPIVSNCRTRFPASFSSCTTASGLGMTP